MMELYQKISLLVVSSVFITLPLASCSFDDSDENSISCLTLPNSGIAPVCSTLNGRKTENCTIEGTSDTSKTLSYKLLSSRECVTIPIENGKKPSILMHDAMVYNKTLLPERLELGRGDELRIKYENELTLPENPERFKDVRDAANNHRMKGPWVSNLHTHGLVTPWDFKDSSAVRGDNVLGVLLDSKKQNTPPGIDPNSWCSTTGSDVAYRYPIRADHEIGLNWYHPHPHGLTGFQVEGGMSGLLMIGNTEAEKHLNPTYLQLKDMQASKRADGSYQFEKFSPPVAGVCHSKKDDLEEGWKFNNDEPGRCNYHNAADATEYSWLFLTNGELFPTIDLPKSAYLRISNSSANATYRLILEPEKTKDQAVGSTVTYYTPPFKVVEKDGMTTTEIAKTNTLDSCTVAMTPATRVGLAVNFSTLNQNSSVCEITVSLKQGESGNTKKIYDVKHKILSDEEKSKALEEFDDGNFILTQAGIDTGEDDWPAVQLATLKPNDKLAQANIDKYQTVLAEQNKHINVTERNDVKTPIDNCEPVIPIADANGINRHVALFYGATKDPETNEDIEHFGLVSSGEKNLNTPISSTTILDWRDEYLKQFSQFIENSEKLGTGGEPITVQSYEAPDLSVDALDGLVSHKFKINEDETVNHNICTQQSNQAERWRIHNLSAQIHNFHIHQLKFDVLNVRGAACTRRTGRSTAKAFELIDDNAYLSPNVTTEELADKMDEQCVKSYAELFHNVPASFKIEEKPPLPSGFELRESAPVIAIAEKSTKIDYGRHDTFPVPPMGYIDIELKLNKPEHVGEYVFHCHILEHEDAGMMGKIVVHPSNMTLE